MIPAGIDPQPVVQVITMKMTIATIVKNIFHPVLSLLLDLPEELLDETDEEFREVEDDVELEPPPILF